MKLSTLSGAKRFAFEQRSGLLAVEVNAGDVALGVGGSGFERRVGKKVGLRSSWRSPGEAVSISFLSLEPTNMSDSVKKYAFCRADDLPSGDGFAFIFPPAARAAQASTCGRSFAQSSRSGYCTIRR